MTLILRAPLGRRLVCFFPQSNLEKNTNSPITIACSKRNFYLDSSPGWISILILIIRHKVLVVFRLSEVLLTNDLDIAVRSVELEGRYECGLN